MVRQKKVLQQGKSDFGYIRTYTVLFAVTVLFVFGWFFFRGRTLIFDGDGWNQHYRAYVYYAQYLRRIVRCLLTEHKLILPEWDITIGQGSDVIQTFQYYCIGDPFAFPVILVPTAYIHYYMDFSVILRLYVSGLMFSFLCFYTGQREKISVLAGSFTYVFCYWGIYTAARHPFFLNPCVWFPLLLLGVEKIIRENRWRVMTIAAAFAALSNFYYFYMMVILTALYVCVRLCFLQQKTWKERLNILSGIAISSLLGCMIAAVLLFPMIDACLGSRRMDAKYAFHLLYPLAYYDALPGLLIGQGERYWLCMGFAAPVFPAVILELWDRKKHRVITALLFCAAGIILLPFVGQALNGFSYRCNRWCWALALLTAYILTSQWNRMMNLTAQEKNRLVLLTGGYAGICLLLENSRTLAVLTALVLLLFFEMILLFDKESRIGRKRQEVCILTLLVCITANAFWKFSDTGDGYANVGVPAKNFTRMKNTDAKAVLKAIRQEEKKNGSSGTTQTVFHRYSGRKLEHNVSTLAGLSTTNFFWTISPGSISQFRADLEISEGTDFLYRGYMDRTALLELAGIDYFVVPESDKEAVPYGYKKAGTYNVNASYTEQMKEKLKQELKTDTLTEEQEQMICGNTQKNYTVYRNTMSLPLGYTYDSYMEKSDFDQLNAVEKQEAMLQSAVVDGYKGEAEEKKPYFTSEEIPYQITGSQHAKIQGNQILVSQAKSSVTLEFTGMSETETYVCLKNLHFQPFPEYDLYFGSDEMDPERLYQKTSFDLKSKKEQAKIIRDRVLWEPDQVTTMEFKTDAGQTQSADYYTEDYNYYNNRHDFTVNLRYSDEAVTGVTITFSKRGVYTFDAIQILCQSMKEYEKQVNRLREETLTDISLGNDRINGTVSLSEPKILCVAIPYSKGWKAYVDGKETDTFQTDDIYLGMDLAAGVHQIQLVYQTPFLRSGMLLSVCGCLLFLLMTEAERFRERRKRSEKESADKISEKLSLKKEGKR